MLSSSLQSSYSCKHLYFRRATTPNFEFWECHFGILLERNIKNLRWYSIHNTSRKLWTWETLKSPWTYCLVAAHKLVKKKKKKRKKEKRKKNRQKDEWNWNKKVTISYNLPNWKNTTYKKEIISFSSSYMCWCTAKNYFNIKEDHSCALPIMYLIAYKEGWRDGGFYLYLSVDTRFN